MGRISIKTMFLWWWWWLCAMKVTIRKTKNQRMPDTIDIVFRPTRFQSGWRCIHRHSHIENLRTESRNSLNHAVVGYVLSKDLHLVLFPRRLISPLFRLSSPPPLSIHDWCLYSWSYPTLILLSRPPPSPVVTVAPRYLLDLTSSNSDLAPKCKE